MPLFWWQQVIGPAPAIALVALALLAMATIAILLPLQARHGRELVRRSVLAQLELAARRGLPLMPALAALTRDFESRQRANGGFVTGLLFPPLGAVRVLRWLMNRQRARDAEAVSDVAAVLREGDIKKALEAAPLSFVAPLPALLGAAERQGALVPALEAVSDLGAVAEGFRSEVRGRLVYPLGVLGFVEVAGVFAYSVFSGRVEALIDLSDSPMVAAILGAQPVMMLATPLVFVGFWLAAGALAPGEGAVARAFRRLPFFARADRMAKLTLLARALAALVRAGVPFPDALRAVARDDLESAAQRAAEGAGIAASLAPALPREAVSFLETTGEGNPAETLAALAAWAESEHRARVGALARVVLPASLVVLGLLVASLYWPPFLAIDQAHSVANRRFPW